MAKKAKTAGAPRAATATDIAKRIIAESDSDPNADQLQSIKNDEIVKLAKKYLALKSK